MKALFDRAAHERRREGTGLRRHLLHRRPDRSRGSSSLLHRLLVALVLVSLGALVPPASFLSDLTPASFLFADEAWADSFVLQRHYLGEGLLDQYGIAVATAGDVDRDGFDDFLVGANVNDEVATSGGKVYLYLGGVVFPDSTSLTFAGDREREYLGGAVAGGGDLNGDGYDDWAVGAPGPGVDGNLPGRVFIFLGGDPVDMVPDFVVEGLTPGGQFGNALAMDGDLDGDGYDDLAVGAPRDSSGVVYLFFGGADFQPTAGDTLFARDVDERFGKALAYWPGHGDGGADGLLVGAPRSGQSATWAGAVLLYRGGPLFDRRVDTIFAGEVAGDAFGSALDASADLNGDGLTDLVVGAPNVDLPSQADVGRAYLFSAAPADTLFDRSWDGIWDGGYFGSSVAAGFDWDGDGLADLVVGAPYAGTETTEEGRVYLFAGGPAPPSAPLDSLIGPVSSAHLGISAADAGDVQHDGRNAMIIGGYNGGDTGRALLYAAAPRGTAAPPPVMRDVARLLSPVPNPFNPRVELTLELPCRGWWTVEIFDQRGRRIGCLHDGTLDEGSHHWRWSGRDDGGRELPSGVYFVRARSADESLVRAMTLIR